MNIPTINNKFRYAFWIILLILFILDIITTKLGLDRGYYEQTPQMINIVPNVGLHVFIKIIAFALLLILLEGIPWLLKNSPGIKIIKLITFIGILFSCVYFLVIVTKNVILLLK
jgi:hypothetical protein